MSEGRNNLIERLTVAYLASEGGLTQEKIAKRLGLSQSAVSRMLKNSKGYLEERVRYRFRSDLVDAATMDQIQQRASLRELDNMLDEIARGNGHKRGPVVRVFSAAENRTEKDLTSRFHEFGAQAAPYVRSLLVRDSVQTCGVTWGFMLWVISIALRNMGAPSPWRKGGPIQFIPLSGDPLHDRRTSPPNLTSSNIVAEMSKIANDDGYRPPWLGLVPAYIPDQFSGQAVKVIERLIHMLPEYEEIFGSKRGPGIASRLDCILTSVGTAASPLGFGRGRLLASLGKRLSELTGQIHGDIGGVLLERNTVRHSRLIAGIERRWKGLSRGHLESCAKRAFDEDPATGRPGVILLAIGEERAEIVLEAVRRGLVNHLIIDHRLERGLEKLAGAHPAGAPPTTSHTPGEFVA